MKKIQVIILVCAAVLIANTAQAGGFAFGLRASSLGGSFELTKSISTKFNLRAGANYAGLSLEGEDEDVEIEYEIDVTLQSFSALIDWHPAGRGFHFTAGAIFNSNEFGLTVTPMNEYVVGVRTFTPDEIGTMTGTIDFEPIAPYFGLGWGNAVREGKGVGVVFDIGVMLQNSPNVNLEAEGMIAPTAEQEPDLEEDLEGAQVWFVVSLGLTFKIF